MAANDDPNEDTGITSLTRFIEDNQRLLAVLSLFIAAVVVSGQIDSAWANIFRGAFVLLALLIWLELIANYRAAVAWWVMPRGSAHPAAWLGREQRLYWFGLLVILGFILFCVYLLVTFPVTALYVGLAILHSPIHLFLMRRCVALGMLQDMPESKRAGWASALSGALTLAVLGAIALAVLAIVARVA